MKSFLSSRIKGLIFDLEGVLYVGNKPIAGASELLHSFKDKKIPCQFLTNTTTKSLDTLHRKVMSMNLPIEKSEILTPSYAAVLYLRKFGSPKCHFILSEEAIDDFSEFSKNENNPDFVVIGDIGNLWNYAILNNIFQMIMNGTEIVALHKGKHWLHDGALSLDIGAFVAGLEYTTGKSATIIGKPSTSFFQYALEKIGLPAKNVAMIGDDINDDIGGAKQAGLGSCILVKSGVYREKFKTPKIQPDLIVETVAELINIL